MDLQEVLCLHEAYTKGRPDGKRAIFRGADLRGADRPAWLPARYTVDKHGIVQLTESVTA